MFLGMLSTAAGAAAPPKATAPKIPTPAELKADLKSITPILPAIGIPKIDPNHLQIPTLPYVQIPPGLAPAFGVLSPTGVTVCQAAYLGPLLGVVALTAGFAALGVKSPPVAPGFLAPAFGPIATLCTLSPFPTYKTCSIDTPINNELKSHLPEIPSLGPTAPSVDVFADIPAPFASIVTLVNAVQVDIQDFVLNDAPPPDITGALASALKCSTR
jgi:hypothetical protein